MSWRERLATLLAARLERQPAASAATPGSTQDDADLELTLDGRSIRAASTMGSALPAIIERCTMRVTIAIVDVSGSMSSYLRKIDDIVGECNRKSSAANLPPGQFVVICFSDRVNAVIDMSEPLAPNTIAHMSGGTSYAVAFDAAHDCVERTREAYPDAQFTIAFMTDGQDYNRDTRSTPQALQALHAAMGPDDTMTSVFFAARANDAVPDSLLNTSKPAMDKVPVMLLTDTSYFTSWLAGAVEKSVTNLTLELPFGRLGPGSAEQGAIGPHVQRMMLNNNGETLSGARVGHWPLTLASAQETVVGAKIVSGSMSWPCKARVKRVTETIALTGQSLLQMLQLALHECLQDTITSAERHTTLAQIRQIIQMSEDPEVRKALTAAEIELLRRAAVGVQAEETGSALTSQKTDQRRTYEQLLASLALATQWSVGKARRAARNIDELRARVTAGKERARLQIEQLQNALVRLQEERLSSNSSSVEPKVDHLVTLSPIDSTEVLVSLWTGPPTGEGADWYTACVAANMGGVRGMPYQQAPYIGLGAWSQMCELNMTGNNAATIGVPVVPLTNRTSAEDEVVALFAPLLCGLFATAQPMIDDGHVAASQLLTTIGHVLQVTEDKKEAHEFADVLVPYAWHLVQKLDPQNSELRVRLIVNRNKENSRNFITSATAWLGYLYCVQRLDVQGGHYPGPDITTGDVYLYEALRQAAKRLHDSSDARNTEKLTAFCDEVAREWTTSIMDSRNLQVKRAEWATPAELAAVADSFVDAANITWNLDAVFKQVCKVLDATGYELRASDRLMRMGALVSKCWIQGWNNLPHDVEQLSEWTSCPTTLELVRQNFPDTCSSLKDADKGIGRLQLSAIVRRRLVDLELYEFYKTGSMGSAKRWTIMQECDTVDLIGNMSVSDIVPPNSAPALETMVRDRVNLVMARPNLQRWFLDGVRKAMPSTAALVLTICQLLGTESRIVLRDPRVQYLLCKEFHCDMSVFAAYQAPGLKLWNDHKRALPSMNTILSKPGQVVIDRCNVRRVVDQVELAADKRTVTKVTFMDGAVMRRTVDGGRCNSVTAHIMGKPFEAQQEFVRFMVIVDDSHGPLPFVHNVVKSGETVIQRPGDKLTALSSLAGYVCTWRDGKWTLESVYQWSAQRGVYMDVIHNFAYFEDTCVPLAC